MMTEILSLCFIWGTRGRKFVLGGRSFIYSTERGRFPKKCAIPDLLELGRVLVKIDPCSVHERRC